MVAFNEARIGRDVSTAEIAAVLIGFPLAIAAIINIVALYRFRPTARRWALGGGRWAVGIIVATLPVYILLGPWIDSGLSELVSNASMVFWGVVLAMMYCQPYAEVILTVRLRKQSNHHLSKVLLIGFTVGSPESIGLLFPSFRS